MALPRSRGKVILMGTGGLNIQLVDDLLREYGFETRMLYLAAKPSLREKFDLVVKLALAGNKVIYTQFAASLKGILNRYSTFDNLVRKKVLCHIVGTTYPEFSSAKDRWIQLVRRLSKSHLIEFVYASENLREEVGVDGDIIPLPFKDHIFSPSGSEFFAQERDVLFYCPAEDKRFNTYKRDNVKEYISTHPDEAITILASSSSKDDDAETWDFPNVIVVNRVPYERMPSLYRSHKKLIRMTSRDGAPKMPYEALLSGCEVWWNGKKVDSIPREMTWTHGGKLLVDRLLELQTR